MSFSTCAFFYISSLSVCLFVCLSLSLSLSLSVFISVCLPLSLTAHVSESLSLYVFNDDDNQYITLTPHPRTTSPKSGQNISKEDASAEVRTHTQRTLSRLHTLPWSSSSAPQPHPPPKIKKPGMNERLQLARY